MYGRRASIRGFGIMVVALSAARGALAQEASPPAGQPHQHETSVNEAEDAAEGMPSVRDSSGTSWLPDLSPMYAYHWKRGDWQVMAHGNVFVQVLDEGGDRGSDQAGSINWFMGMAQRPAGPGRVTFRGMLSAEPWTVGGCGYPDLLASGERCNGEAIHDRQHPHDLMMELAAQYDAPLKGPVRWLVYGGPVGEPALGPVAYPHRVSAFPNPVAPIAHHWLDSTHITFGVLTGALYGSRWKSEVSVFNGREPDEDRADFDFGAFDSVAGRLWFLPSTRLALQFSAGRLSEAEIDEHGGNSIDVTRLTASATYHNGIGANGLWATTVAWGRNDESGQGSNAILAETHLTLRDRDSVFGRFEAVGKTAHDLEVADSDDVFTVAKLQGGYTRYFTGWSALKTGIGGALSAAIVPDDLKTVYGSRVNLGVGVFFTIRPAAMDMTTGSGSHDHSQHAPGIN